MTMDREYLQDDRTVLLDRQGLAPGLGPVTDCRSPPRFEQLQARMHHAARLPDAQHFTGGLGTLVAAAWELLSEVVRLKYGEAGESLHVLNERLASQITLFETRARDNGALVNEITAARYVLCSVIDETVVTRSGGNRSDWLKNSLLRRFHNQVFGGEKVFQLLEQLSADPVKHLAMLELIYLCLALGFEGKYRGMDRGGLQLERVREALYLQIRQVRGDLPPAPASPPAVEQPRRWRMPVVPASWVAMCVLASLLVMYFGFSWVLGQQRETVLQPYQLSAPDIPRTSL